MAMGNINLNMSSIFDMLNQNTPGSNASISQQHSQNVQYSNMSDVFSQIREVLSKQNKIIDDINREYSDPIRRRSATSEVKDVRESQVADILRNYRERENPYESERINQQWAQGGARKISGLQGDELENALHKLKGSFEGLDSHIQKSGFMDIMRMAISGGAGASIYHGMSSGNAVTTGMGVIAGAATVQDAYRNAKLKEEEAKRMGEEYQSSPIGEGLKQLGIVILSGAIAALQDSYGHAIEKSRKAFSFQEAGIQARQGGLSLSTQDILGEQTWTGLARTGSGMGNVGDVRVLSPEQIQSGLQLFGTTGGGTNEQFREMMEIFTKNTVFYGEAGMTIINAARNLDQWVPKGDFAKQIDTIANNLTSKAGLSTALMKETIEAFSGQITNSIKYSLDPKNTGVALWEQAERISTKYGLAGQQGAAAVQQGQGLAAKALSNSSMYSYFASQGISGEEIAEWEQTGKMTPEIEAAIGNMGSLMEIPGQYLKKSALGRIMGKDLAELSYRGGTGINPMAKDPKDAYNLHKIIDEGKRLWGIQSRQNLLEAGETLKGGSRQGIFQAEQALSLQEFSTQFENGVGVLSTAAGEFREAVKWFIGGVKNAVPGAGAFQLSIPSTSGGEIGK